MRWLDDITDNGHEFEQAPGVDDGQGRLVHCTPWGWKESEYSVYKTTGVLKPQKCCQFYFQVLRNTMSLKRM